MLNLNFSAVVLIQKDLLDGLHPLLLFHEPFSPHTSKTISFRARCIQKLIMIFIFVEANQNPKPQIT
jgi:hypothetical protein